MAIRGSKELQIALANLARELESEQKNIESAETSQYLMNVDLLDEAARFLAFSNSNIADISEDNNFDDSGEYGYDDADYSAEANDFIDRQDDWLESLVDEEEQFKEWKRTLNKEFPDEEKEQLKEWKKELNKKELANYLVVATTILELAKAKCPIATGALRNSGKVIRYRRGYAVVFGMGYRFKVKNGKKIGKAPINYATFVHEIGYYRHVVGQAKYLEDAAIEVINSGEFENIEFKPEVTIEYDVTREKFNGCMIVYVGRNMPGTSLEIIQAGTSLLHEEYTAWSLGLQTNNDDKYMHRFGDLIRAKYKARKLRGSNNNKEYRQGLNDLIQNTFVVTKGELKDLVSASKEYDERKLDALARAHVSDFTKRGSFLKTFYHLYAKEDTQSQ